MEETGWWRNNLSFRDWEYYDRSPAANFFHPAITEDGLFDRVFYPNALQNRRFAQDEEIDLYSISPPTLAATAPFPRKERKLRQLMQRTEEEHSPRRNTAPPSFGGGAAGEKSLRKNRGSKAVDEDLYKIPSELLYRKPIRKRTSACEFLARCLRLNCIA